ncbi:transposase [Streptomyces sp. SCSIO 30461]|uniref:transposase n=1 Tax=Streptomyces sp. SCSIO 30461 TaxID=3118085 RepID=UPI0030D506E3
MNRFATAGHLASWAGMCPGNNESAGRRMSGRTRHGDTWLKTALYMAGSSAARMKATYLGAQFRRLVPHRGVKRATVAVGHSILVAHLARRCPPGPRSRSLHQSTGQGTANPTPARPTRGTWPRRDHRAPPGHCLTWANAGTCR